MKNIKKIGLSLAVVSALGLGFVGCGGGGGGSSNPTETTQTGYLVDSGIEGLNYTTSSGITGVTGEGGTYKFKDGDTVVFKLGGVQIGSEITAKNEAITPILLYGESEDSYENNLELTNFLRFIQTIDDDGNHENGIKIDENIKTLFSNKSTFDFYNETDIKMALTTANINKKLIDKDDAIKNMDDSISKIYLNVINTDNDKIEKFNAYYGGIFELKQKAINGETITKLDMIEYQTNLVQGAVDITSAIIDPSNNSDKELIIQIAGEIVKTVANINEVDTTSATVSLMVDIVTMALTNDFSTNKLEAIKTALLNNGLDIIFDELGIISSLSDEELKNKLTILGYNAKALLALAKGSAFDATKLIADGVIINVSALTKIIALDGSSKEIADTIISQEYVRLYYLNNEKESSMIDFINEKFKTQLSNLNIILDSNSSTDDIINTLAGLSKFENYSIWKKIGVWFTTDTNTYIDQYAVYGVKNNIDEFKINFEKYYEESQKIYTPPLTYSWATSSYGSCTGDCGTDNATQTRTVTCEDSDGNSASDSMCTDTKPSLTQSCTASVCEDESAPIQLTYSWATSSYGSCTGDCGTDNGTKTRTIACEDSDGNSASDSMCTDIKPDVSLSCTASACEETPVGYIHNVSSGTITSPTGQVWMDRNLGASQVCASYNDTACYGDYYQWGRGSDGHQKLTSNTTTTESTSITPNHSKFIIGSNDWTLNDDDNIERVANWNPCPSGFRIPTSNELLSENISDTNNAFETMKIPFTGYRTYQGEIKNTKSSLWTISYENSGYPKYLLIDDSTNLAGSGNRAYGRSIRCIKK